MLGTFLPAFEEYRSGCGEEMEAAISLRRGLKIPFARYISIHGPSQLRVVVTQTDPRALVATSDRCPWNLPVWNPATIGYVASSSEVQHLSGRTSPLIAAVQFPVSPGRAREHPTDGFPLHSIVHSATYP